MMFDVSSVYRQPEAEFVQTLILHVQWTRWSVTKGVKIYIVGSINSFVRSQFERILVSTPDKKLAN